MASYAVEADLETEFLNTAFTGSTAITSTEIGTMLSDDAAVIDAWIANRYSVPVTSGASPIAFSVLKRINLMMTKSRLKRILSAGAGLKKKSQEEAAEALEKQAYKLIDAIKDGTMILSDATRVSAVANSYGYENEQEAVFKMDEDQW